MHNPKYIIIQAGGKGGRLEHMTLNKPKALVSINGKPNILQLMSMFPKSYFYVIGDYKKDIFKKYLKKYCNFKYKFIEAIGNGSAAGIKQALKFVPNNNPLMIVWCDIYFDKMFLPADLDLHKNNYIGLSAGLFKCRYSFKKNRIVLSSSSRLGIAGVYLFKNKQELSYIKMSGEFAEFLDNDKLRIKPFDLINGHEFGTLPLYDKVVKNFKHTRPFNKIVLLNDKVIKTPLDKQGASLAALERLWYKKVERFNFCFIPKIYNYNPLTMQKINGQPLQKYKLSKRVQKEILAKIVKNLETLHSSFKPKHGDFHQNDYEAIIGKTKARLDGIIDLVPQASSDHFIINGKKCLNFYKQWKVVIKEAEKYQPKEYRFIHGDQTFSNTLMDEKNNNPIIIDPRGYYGQSKIYGDVDYDWAKVYYSIVGNYDNFNHKHFRLKIDGNKIELNIKSSGWENLSDYYLNIINRNKQKIQFFHAIIWLSLSSYAWDDYDSICGAFYNGIRYLQEYFDNLNV